MVDGPSRLSPVPAGSRAAFGAAVTISLGITAVSKLTSATLNVMMNTSKGPVSPSGRAGATAFSDEVDGSNLLP